MSSANYHIVRRSGGWCIEHDRDVSQPYLTREAAFEAIIGQVSNALKTGDAVTINVDGPPAGEAALGIS
ncbi:MAG TPA: hypothetical protein VG986_19815 [Pseudolabrys sp.]|nr:hypothetical protein [Pseudolabrys sp.]